MVKELLLKGANVDHVNRKGNTALWLAAKKGKYRAVEALLAKGADAKHQNKEGEAVLYWPNKKGLLALWTC